MTIDEQGKDYADNGERATFFARGVLETVKKLRWVPDIIHVQGWMGAVVPLYIKTAYHEEPSFANTKVVTSLFPKSFKSDLGSNFKQCVVFKDAKADLLKKYDDKFTFEELGKLAIDYSDGVIAAHKSANKELMKYAAEKNIPTLSYPGEDFAQVYEEFYEKI
jgi:starch synthase